MPAWIEPMLTIAPLRAAGHHVAGDDLADRPRALEVDIGDPLPFGVVELEEGHDRLDAGIVDEDVDRAELRR